MSIKNASEEIVPDFSFLKLLRLFYKNKFLDSAHFLLKLLLFLQESTDIILRLMLKGCFSGSVDTILQGITDNVVLFPKQLIYFPIIKCIRASLGRSFGHIQLGGNPGKPQDTEIFTVLIQGLQHT